MPATRAVSPTRALLLLLLLGLLAAAFPVVAEEAPGTAARAAASCTVTQVTADPSYDSYAGGFSADGRWLALTSEADLTGGNPSHTRQLFLLDRTSDTLSQLTTIPNGVVRRPIVSADGSTIYFLSSESFIDVPLANGEVALTAIDRATGTPTELLRGPILDADVATEGSIAALLATFDPAGDNPDGNAEIFLLDLTTGDLEQYTQTVDEACSPFGQCPRNESPRVDALGRHVAFRSGLDLLGDSPEGGAWGGLYVADLQEGTLERVALHTDPAPVLSGDGTTVAFPSFENLTGDNPKGFVQLYLSDDGGASYHQVPMDGLTARQPAALDATGTRFAFSAAPGAGQPHDAFLFDRASGATTALLASQGATDLPKAMTPDGSLVAVDSKANVAGGNPDGSFEVFVASCAAAVTPEPPAGPWITDAQYPDFQLKVRITPQGGEPAPVQKESACIPETVCISGALPGRSELFLRIVGPKPNGRLWPTLVRFSTSRVEVWIEQLSTESVRYYRLDGASPGSDQLPGLFDRDGFVPQS
jgi:hypothetical protein